MAGQSITFDFLSRGSATVAGDFRKVGDNAALASRGAKILSDVIEKLGSKEDRTAAESKILASALKQTGDAADRTTAKMVLADASIRRLGDSMQDSQKKSDGLGKSLSGLKLNPGLAGPLVALIPALGTLTGVAAGAAAGLGGAFIAGGAALAAFGAVAKPVLTDAKTAAAAVEKAQNNYTAAIAGGTKQSVAYKAEQIAIAKAYANLSPAQVALSKQLGAMASAWDDVKAAQTPVVAGALQPWLKSVTDLTGQLGPIIAKVAPVIAYLGGQFDALVRSSAFKQFRDFIGSTGAAAVSAGGSTMIDLIKAFIIILPKFDPLIREAIGWISRLGPAVLTWAGSQKTADHITTFMQWFSTNGPVVGTLLTNIGGALKALAPGLASGGAIEIKVISDFLGLVAKLPPAVAKPLAEVAGAALILSKMGVLKVGLQVVGPALKWLTGGLINIGGGASAAAEIRAAFASGGAAAAAQIRAAMVGGGAAGGAEGAAGGAAAKGGIAGALGASAAAAGPVAAGLFVAAFIRAVGDKLSPQGTFAGNLNKQFQASGQMWSTTLLHSFTFGGLEAWMTAKFGIPVGKAINATLAYLRTQWDIMWANTVTGAVQDWKTLVAVFDSAGHQIARIWDVLTNDMAKAFDIAANYIGIAWDHIKLDAFQAVKFTLDIMGKLPFGMGQPFRDAAKSIGNSMAGVRADVARRTGQIQADIDSIHGKNVNVGVNATSSGAVKAFQHGLTQFGTTWALQFHAAGGKITGGTPGKDSVLGVLTPGEVVVPEPMVKAGAVDHLRGKLPRFAAGGLVGNLNATVDSMSGLSEKYASTLENRYAAALIAAYKKAAANGLGAFGPAIVGYARSFLGKIPYVFGGNSLSGGIDCSGFTQAIYSKFGIHAPRTSEAQYAWATKSGPVPGGLAFYVSPAGGPPPGHVAIVQDARTVISQGGGMGPTLMGLHAMPLMGTGIPKGVGLPASAGGFGNQAPIVGGGTGTLQQIAQTLLRQRGWIPQWPSFNALENREAGWNLTARNPSSGAYGLAQFINGPSEYYQYGGNPDTGAGQLTAMMNYLAQRYGGPDAAWNHESLFGWYDRGGWLPRGLSLAYNGTGRPEQVIPHGGRGGGGTVVLENHGVIGSRLELENWLVRSIDAARRKGRI